MSIQDESQLKARLGSALDAIEPHPAPLATVVRQGTGIRQRRRVAAVAGLAVVVAAAVLGPTVLRHELASPPPPSTHVPHYTVRVNPPPKGAKPGVIATGSINGRDWTATLSGRGSGIGVGFGGDLDFSRMVLGEPSKGISPAEFDSEGGSRSDTAYVGQVAQTIRYLRVALSNGQVLTLRPQPWHGYHYAAMVLPQKLLVTEAIAYGPRGEIRYAIPFNYQGSASIVTWLRPGQTGVARATARIGGGGSGRFRWTATAFVGPWGLCGEVVQHDGGGGFCQVIGDRSPSGLVSGQFGSGVGGVEVGLARHDVAYLMVTRSDGSVLRINAVHIAGNPDGLTAVIRPGHPSFKSWIAYDSRGRRLGSGNGDPVGLR